MLKRCSLIFVMLLLLTSCAKQDTDIKTPDTVKSGEPAEPVLSDSEAVVPKIGIAWRYNKDGEPSVQSAVAEAIRLAGGEPVALGEVFFNGFDYDAEGRLPDSYTGEHGELKPEYAQMLRNFPHSSDAEDVLGDIDMVVFPGGGDPSPALFNEPEEVNNDNGRIDATRDVSEYLTMYYCLEHDIGIFGICRGMQFLGLLSDADFIQDLDVYYTEHGKEYTDTHKQVGNDADYARHNVTITRKEGLTYSILGSDVLRDVASKHHQAIADKETSTMAVTGVFKENGISIAEIIERKDKSFALGVQFHPEITLVRSYDSSFEGAEPANGEKALSLFKAVVAFAAQRGNR